MIETEEKIGVTIRQPLPAGWHWVRLGDHTTKIGSGLTPYGGQATYLQSGVPLIRSQNVHISRFVPTGLVYISHAQDDEMRASKVLPGDVLLNITGASIGRVCVVPQDLSPANVNQHVCIIRGDGTFDPSFLSYYISTSEFQKSIFDTQAGATRQALTKAIIEDFRIPLPPLSEQQRIATILNEQITAVERARAAVETQLGLLRKLIEAELHQSFLSGPVLRVKLNECLEEVSKGVGESWKNYHVIGATRAGLAPAKENIGKNPGRYKLVDIGTIFYNPMRILLGSIATVNNDDEIGITSPDYVVFKTRNGILHSSWFYYWLRSGTGEDFIKTLTRGAVRERMLFKRLASAEIDLPSWNLQLEIADKLKLIAQMKGSLEQQLNAINQLPASLLHQAFSGAL